MKSIVAVILALCATWLGVANAQPYPNRPIRLLVGYPAGGGADALARLTATHLSEALGQQVVVDNRAGAGGTLAADAVARMTVAVAHRAARPAGEQMLKPMPRLSAMRQGYPPLRLITEAPSAAAFWMPAPNSKTYEPSPYW